MFERKLYIHSEMISKHLRRLPYHQVKLSLKQTKEQPEEAALGHSSIKMRNFISMHLALKIQSERLDQLQAEAG